MSEPLRPEQQCVKTNSLAWQTDKAGNRILMQLCGIKIWSNRNQQYMPTMWEWREVESL